jgi:cytochrome bd-type quinol oxidase subunit 2
MVRALVIGAAFFLVATAWSWWRFRARIASERGRGSA